MRRGLLLLTAASLVFASGVGRAATETAEDPSGDQTRHWSSLEWPSVLGPCDDSSAELTKIGLDSHSSDVDLWIEVEDTDGAPSCGPIQTVDTYGRYDMYIEKRLAEENLWLRLEATLSFAGDGIAEKCVRVSWSAAMQAEHCERDLARVFLDGDSFHQSFPLAATVVLDDGGSRSYDLHGQSVRADGHAVKLHGFTSVRHAVLSMTFEDWAGPLTTTMS